MQLQFALAFKSSLCIYFYANKYIRIEYWNWLNGRGSGLVPYAQAFSFFAYLERTSDSIDNFRRPALPARQAFRLIASVFHPSFTVLQRAAQLQSLDSEATNAALSSS